MLFSFARIKHNIYIKKICEMRVSYSLTIVRFSNIKVRKWKNFRYLYIYKITTI